VVTAEQGATIGKAKVVGRVAGGSNSRHRLAVDIDAFPVTKHPVRRIIPIERRIGARSNRFQRKPSAADNRRSGTPGERTRSRAVVEVRVGAHDCGHCPSANRFFECVDVLGQVRPGIDDREPRFPDQVGLRPKIGERRRIVREHSGNTGLELLEFCIGRIHLDACATARVRLLAAQVVLADAPATRLNLDLAVSHARANAGWNPEGGRLPGL